MGRKRNNGLSEEKRSIIGQLIEIVHPHALHVEEFI